MTHACSLAGFGASTFGLTTNIEETVKRIWRLQESVYLTSNIELSSLISVIDAIVDMYTIGANIRMITFVDGE